MIFQRCKPPEPVAEIAPPDADDSNAKASQLETLTRVRSRWLCEESRHSMMVSSYEPLTMRLPSGEKATE